MLQHFVYKVPETGLLYLSIASTAVMAWVAKGIANIAMAGIPSTRAARKSLGQSKRHYVSQNLNSVEVGRSQVVRRWKDRRDRIASGPPVRRHVMCFPWKHVISGFPSYDSLLVALVFVRLLPGVARGGSCF